MEVRQGSREGRKKERKKGGIRRISLGDESARGLFAFWGCVGVFAGVLLCIVQRCKSWGQPGRVVRIWVPFLVTRFRSFIPVCFGFQGLNFSHALFGASFRNLDYSFAMGLLVMLQYKY